MGDYNIDINVNMGGSDQNATFKSLTEAVQQLNVNLNNVGAASKSAGSQTKSSFEEAMRTVAKFKDGIGGLEREILKTKQAILDENEALRKGVITQSQYDANINKLTSSYQKLNSVQRQYNTFIGQTGKNTASASSAIYGLTAAFNKLGAVLGVSFGLYGVFRGLQFGIKTIAEFDLAQKKLQSVLGETSAGMKEISESAMAIGRSSIFGAKGVSELQIELAKMGFAKQEIIAMQQAIVNLATATQEDLASSAEVVANIIRAYSLSASEAARVTDVMGKAFNDSALDLSNFREAIKYVAPVAAQAGFSIEETVAALELLSNVGLKGSLAGTGLNNVLKAMMDSNSKLAKSLGGTVSGYEGFLSVLRRANEEGWNTEKIFGVITQRATAAFTTMANGVEDIEAFRKSLENASGTMKDQANVQLESLTYQAKLAKESIKNLFLELDNGNGILTKVIKGWLGFARALGVTDTTREKFIDGIKETISETDSYVKFALETNQKGIADIIQSNIESLDGWAKELDKRSDFYFIANEKIASDAIERSTNNFNKIIDVAARKMASNFDIQLKQTGNLQKALANTLKLLQTEQSKLQDGTPRWLALAKAIELVNQKYGDLTKTGGTNGSFEVDKARIRQLQLIKEQFELSKKLEENNFQDLKDIALAIKELDKEIAKESIENKEELRLKLELIDAQYIQNLEEITEKETKYFEKVEKARFDSIKKLVDDTKKYIESEGIDSDEILIFDKLFNTKYIKENYDKVQKFFEDNPIYKIFGEKAEGLGFISLFGITDAEEMEDFKKGFEEFGSFLKDSLENYVDSWVDATDRIVDQLNRQIDETQSALDTEAELMAAGYANNVTLKRKELEDLKKLRASALEDQKKAQKAQVAVETLTQISSLITASAQVLEGFSKIPIVGVPLGIAAIATMIAAFTAAKIKAFETAGVTKYAKGGWIGGKSHAEGGTPIEAEKGEFVIRKSSAMKHKSLIEAINMDDSVKLNRIYLDKLRSGVLNHRVSLDDSKDLRAIRNILEKPEKQVTYYGEYRIEKYGNITKKVKISQN